MLPALHDPSKACPPRPAAPAQAPLPAAASRQACVPPRPQATAQAPGARPSASILPFPGAAGASRCMSQGTAQGTTRETPQGASGRAAQPASGLRAAWAGNPPVLAGTPPARASAPHGTARCVPADAAMCLTVADRIALLAWGSQGSAGYARVVLVEGVPGSAPDRGGYVLLYRQHDPWAVVGLTRQATGVLVWRCSDGSACGEYPTMAAALAALPPASGQG